MSLDPHERTCFGNLAGVLDGVNQNSHPVSIIRLGNLWLVQLGEFVQHFNGGRVADPYVLHDEQWSVGRKS